MKKTSEILYKYPRTPHLPHSPGVTSDDKIHKDMTFFNGKEVVVTLKMDGENTTIGNDYYHARSLDSNNHPSRNFVKGLAAEKIYGNLPGLWRICGENLFAKHSIHYEQLESYFYAFSIWDSTNTCLDWDQTIEWLEVLEILPVKVIYRGIYNQNEIDKAFSLYSKDHEGYVMRLTNSIPYDEFELSFAKYVRANHVQANSEHWMHTELVKNLLKDTENTFLRDDRGELTWP
jgi:Ca2+-binding EF-hand superfamily protein